MRLRPLLALYMRRSQVGEMRDLSRLVDRTLATRARQSFTGSACPGSAALVSDAP